MGERPGDYRGASLPDVLARLRRPAAVTAGGGPTVPADSHVLYPRRPPYWAVARWAHVAAFPKYEGDNSNDMKDPNGKLVQIELIKMAQERGSGWVDYLWPKPGQSQPSQKWAYVKAVKIDGSQGLWSGLLSSITETSGARPQSAACMKPPQSLQTAQSIAKAGR